MRLRRGAPLLLLLAPSLSLADVVAADSLGNEEILALNRAPNAQLARSQAANLLSPTTAAANAKTTPKLYLGTEDAPVDGQDGKPHAGPFVDRIPDDAKTKKIDDPSKAAAKALPTSLENMKSGEWRDIPEKNDGVMDDEHRPLPKKGTTGTQGGITEKAKARKELDGGVENKPQEPKRAPDLPHSEEVHLAKADDKKVVSSPDKKDPAGPDGDARTALTGEKKKSSGKKAGEYGEAGYGLEKPTDLPEKPHNIPFPSPKSVARDDFGPPINPAAGKDKWLVDTMPETEGKTNPRPVKAQPNKAEPKKAAAASADSQTYDNPHHETWHEWFHSFVLSFTMIIFSEIGDKTFLVAALMAMRHARLLVFSAALAALVAMTILSAVLGHAFPTLLPKKLTTLAAALLFFVFGARSLREGLAMPRDAGIGEEMREVEAELEEEEDKMRRRDSKGHLLSPYDLEGGRRGRSPGTDKMGRAEPSPPLSRSPSPAGRRTTATSAFAGVRNLLSLVLTPAWVSTFIMTFLGEWGDRSQIATIAMAAGQDYWWVTLGAIVGHACCTGLAVIGGRALAGRVSMRIVTIGGAVAFLVFGCIYLYECWTD